MVTNPSEIVWSDPVLPLVRDPEWEIRVKRHMGIVPDFMKQTAPSRWLREVNLLWSGYPFTHTTKRDRDIAFLVISQENACRYCYGAARALLRIQGYGDALITQLERETQLAELDEREQAFVAFCRDLARSKPRPGRAAREKLIALGYSPLTVLEIAFVIALNCFGNRITTLLACPPPLGLERMAYSWWFAPLRPLLGRMMGRAAPILEMPPFQEESASAVALALRGLPAAGLLDQTLRDAFDSPVLPRQTKALMFAVIARSLQCLRCELEARAMLESSGLSPQEVSASLDTLTAPREDPEAQALIEWARGTVHYESHVVQQRTRELVAKVGPDKALEAVGLAALANATVRLAMLLE